MNQSAVPDVSPATLEVVPLGGLGEFGMNMMAVSWEDTTILIDAGVMFPEPDQLGVDLIIPDMTFVESRRSNVKALILTHGHEDHIGAVPHVMPMFDGPVYGTAMTLAFVQPKLDEHEIDAGDRLKTVSPKDTVTVGPFSIEFIRVTHSMPDCVALAITTPAGTIVHTGDFKIDQTPIDGQHFDLHRFAELGSQGVLALFADSTNVDRKGFTGPETEVIEAFEELFTSTHGKLVVAAFSSSIYRMQVLVDLATQFERKVAFVGRSIVQNSEIAQRLGYLRDPRRPADSGQRRLELHVSGRALHRDRVAGRTPGRALAYRDRRSSVRQAQPGRHGGLLGSRDSWEREGDRSHDEPCRPARRRCGDIRHEARPRLWTWLS